METYSITIDASSFNYNPNNNYLLLINVFRKPPHLTFILNDTIAELSLEGKRINQIRPERLLELLEIKELPTLVLELKPQLLEDPYNRFLEVLEPYDKVNGEATCFSPIKDWLQKIDEERFNVTYFYEILEDSIKFNHLFSHVYSLNIELKQSNTLVLDCYTKADVLERVRQDLEKKNSKS